MNHIIVNIDDVERVFSTEENVQGRIEITVPNTATVHNDDIRIAFEGIQHIWQTSDGYGVGPSSGRYDIRKKFLYQQLHPSRSDIAVTDLGNGSKLITVAFEFTIPSKLLPTSCKHDGIDSALLREHLQLPPTMGRSNWSSKCLDDLTPDMINVSYMVRAQLLKRGDDKNVLAEDVGGVFVLPQYPEKPAQYISPSDEGRGLYRLWQSQDVSGGKLHVEAEQPKPIQIVGLKSSGTRVPVRLRFTPDGNEARLPVLDIFGLDFNAISHYSTIGIGDDVTVASAVEGVHSYPRRIFSVSRDCGSMGWTKDTDGSYLSELAVPITVPDDKILLPSVQNCYMARTYLVELRLVLGGKGKGRATRPFALKVPVQVVVEHRSPSTDGGAPEAEARVSEDGIELASLSPGYSLHLTRSLAHEPTLPPPPLEHDSYPLTEAQIPVEGGEEPPPELSMLETAIIIFSVKGVTFLGSMSNGIMVVLLPTIAKDIGLSQSLTLWPQSVFSLVCGTFLLLMGNITDIVGSRRAFLFGCILYSIFTLAQGFCNSGSQLIAFRAIQGFAMAACLPSAVSVLTNSFPAGRWRNLGFVMLSVGQPLGFAVGLVVSGVLTKTIGWRWIFYISTAINAAISVGAAFALPKHLDNHNLKFKDFYDADWVGSAIASGALGTFSYVVAITSESHRRWSSPSTITLIVLSAILAYAFFFWVTRQERLGRPCLLPPSLWRNTAFTAICGTVFFTWAAMNAGTLTLTLVFQEVQHLSPSETSIRLLPDVGSGILVSILVGYLIDKTSTYWLVVSAAAVALASPLLMALMDPAWSYWAAAFPAIFLGPVSTDVLYTVSNLVITREFPKKTQGLAGAVFNTLVQISTSVGIGLSSLVAAMVMQRAAGAKSIQMVAHDGLVVGGGNATQWYTGVELEGYRGSFWTCFGFLAAAVVVAGGWLRDIVDVGKKQD